MIRKVIYPQNKEDLMIQLPEKFIDKQVEIIVFIKEDLDLKDSDFEEVKEINNNSPVEQLSIKSFNEIWETPENEHWDKFLASKI
jgi:hypothetical protein